MSDECDNKSMFDNAVQCRAVHPVVSGRFGLVTLTGVMLLMTHFLANVHDEWHCDPQVVPSTAIGFTLYDSAKQFLGLKGNI